MFLNVRKGCYLKLTANLDLLINSIFQMNETLITLKIDGNKFGRVGGLALAGALQVNTTLEELDITNTEQVFYII